MATCERLARLQASSLFQYHSTDAISVAVSGVGRRWDVEWKDCLRMTTGG
jgi:hypothetical protein